MQEGMISPAAMMHFSPDDNLTSFRLTKKVAPSQRRRR
jgi:hypothetical protein